MLSYCVKFAHDNIEILLFIGLSILVLVRMLCSLYIEIFGTDEQKLSNEFNFYKGDYHFNNEEYNKKMEIKGFKAKMLLYAVFIVMGIAAIVFAVPSLKY